MVHFIFYSIVLGVALAMDAFSVSIADAIKEPRMRKTKMCIIALTYAFFQFIMPMAGFIFVHTLVGIFQAFQTFIPWIAFVLLCYIGGKNIFSVLRGEGEIAKTGTSSLFFQGVATSIDALSVGFTIASYSMLRALFSSAIIAATTFVICFSGLLIGKKAGETLGDKAQILGGAILVVIGVSILLRNLL